MHASATDARACVPRRAQTCGDRKGEGRICESPRATTLPARLCGLTCPPPLPFHLQAAENLRTTAQPRKPTAGARGLFTEFEYIPSRYSLADELGTKVWHKDTPPTSQSRRV